jgi:alkylation response protein AidB-like acyl-CoA dehydrogenase
MGGENLHEVQFNDCELPLENLVIREDGFRKLLTAFNTQRYLNPSISLGLAEGAFDEAVSYVREREIFGRALAASQGVRWKLADMFRISKPAAACCIEPVSPQILFPIHSSRLQQRCSATRCPSG